MPCRAFLCTSFSGGPVSNGWGVPYDSYSFSPCVAPPQSVVVVASPAFLILTVAPSWSWFGPWSMAQLSPSPQRAVGAQSGGIPNLSAPPTATTQQPSSAPRPCPV